MAIAAAVALSAGVYAAERHGQPGDAAVMTASQLGLAVPNFWFGIVLVLIFAVHWRLAPAGGFPVGPIPRARSARSSCPPWRSGSCRRRS